MEELDQIKKLRRKLGLTQSELAMKANVSQSLIAKIESGNIEPSYTKAKSILNTLYQLEKKHSISAKDMMYKRLICISPQKSLKQAIKKMRKYEISQMPVKDNNKIVGYISDSILLENMMDQDTESLSVRDVMKDTPPILPPDTSKEVIANLLKHFPLVLIEEKGKLKGLITKADLLRVI